MASTVRLVDKKFYAQLNNGDDFSLNTSDFASTLKGGVTESIKAVFTVQVDWQTYMATFDVIMDFAANQSVRITDQTVNFQNDGIQVGDSIKWSVDDSGTKSKYTGVVASITGGEIVIGSLVLDAGVAITDGVHSYVNIQSYITGLTDLISLNYKFGLIENSDSFNTLSKLTNSDQVYSMTNIDHGVPLTWSDGISLGNNKAWVTGSSRVSFSQLVLDKDLIYNETTTQEFIIEHTFKINPLYRDGEIDSLKGVDVPPLDIFNGSLSLKYVFETEFRTVVNDPNTAKIAELETLEGSTGYLGESFNGFPNRFLVSNVTYFDVNNSVSINKIDANTVTRVECVINSLDGVFTSSTPIVVGHSSIIDSTKYSNSSVNYNETWLNESVRNITGSAAVSNSIITDFSADFINANEIEIAFDLVYSSNQVSQLINDQYYALTYVIQDPSENVQNGGKVVDRIDVNQYSVSTDIEGLMDVTVLEQFAHPEVFNGSYGLRFNNGVSGQYMDLGLVPLLNSAGDYMEFSLWYKGVFNTNTITFGFLSDPFTDHVQIYGDTDINSVRIQIQNGGLTTVDLSSYASTLLTIKFLAINNNTYNIYVNGDLLGSSIYSPFQYSSLPFFIGARNFQGAPDGFTDCIFKSAEFNTSLGYKLFNDDNNWGGATNYGGIRELIFPAEGYTSGKMFIEDGQQLLSQFNILNEYEGNDVNIDSLSVKIVAFNRASNDWFCLRDFPLDLSSQVQIGNVQNMNLNANRGYVLKDDDFFNEVSLTTKSNDGTWQSYELIVGYKIPWQYWVSLIDANTVFFDNSKPLNGLNNNSSNYCFSNDYRLRMLIDANITTNGITTNYVKSTGDFQAYNYRSDDLSPDGYTCEITTHDSNGNTLSGNIIVSGFTEFRASFFPAASNQPSFTVDVDFTEVANSWGKYAHGNKNNGLNLPFFTRLPNWVDDQADDVDEFTDGTNFFTKNDPSLYTSTSVSITVNQNCAAVYGAYSPIEREYYELSGEMFSDFPDNDVIKFDIAFFVDENGVEHTLSLAATTGGVLLDVNPNYILGDDSTDSIQYLTGADARWALVYNLGKGDCQQIDQFLTGEIGYFWDDPLVGDFKFTVNRSGDVITVDSEWDINSTNYTNTFSYNLNDNNFTTMFKGPKSIGYSFLSQTNGGFKNVSLIDPSADYYAILRIEEEGSTTDAGINELSTMREAPENNLLTQITGQSKLSTLSYNGSYFVVQGLVDTGKIDLGKTYKLSALLRAKNLEV